MKLKKKKENTTYQAVSVGFHLRLYLTKIQNCKLNTDEKIDFRKHSNSIFGYTQQLSFLIYMDVTMSTINPTIREHKMLQS